MNLLALPPEIWLLELALILLALITAVCAYLLIRSARRAVTIQRKPPAHLPSTPLTRETRKRVRALSIV